MSAANYALCDSCDGKVFYVGDMDVPLDAVVTHVDCQLKELAKARAEGRRQAAADIRAEIIAAAPIPKWAQPGGRPTASGLREWAARIAEGTDHA